MKKIITLLAIALTFAINAQDFPKVDKSPLDVAYFPSKATHRAFAKTEEQKMALQPKMRIIYSRPLKKGREIFGKLVEFEKKWRLGANETTEVNFMTDVMIGAKKIKAGRYTMFAIPSAKEWKVVFNTGLDDWGVYAHDETKDVASISVPTQKLDKELEAFSISLYAPKKDNTVHIKMGWDTTAVEVPVTIL